MKYLVILSPDADRDLQNIEILYTSVNAALAARFQKRIDIALERLETIPYAYPWIDDKYRRVTLREFPYHLYFKVENLTVTVAAVLHQRRDVWPRN